MLFEPVDLKNLPNTSNIDGVPIYNNPIKVLRRLFFKRLELCLKFLEIKRGNVLDMGCGSGIVLPTLSKIHGLIIGLDIHKNLNRVHQYLKKNKFPNISLIRASSDYLPFKEGSFRSILCISSLDHLIEPNKTINELYRVSTVKGSLITGIHKTNLFYFIMSSLFIIFYLISYCFLFRNYREFFSANFKMTSWKHIYSDTELIQIISKIFDIREVKYLGARWPAYVAVKGIKKKC